MPPESMAIAQPLPPVDDIVWCSLLAGAVDLLLIPNPLPVDYAYVRWLVGEWRKHRLGIQNPQPESTDEP